MCNAGESQLMLIRQGVRIHSFMEALDDREEQLMLSEVCQPGVSQGVDRARCLWVGVVCRAGYQPRHR